MNYTEQEQELRSDFAEFISMYGRDELLKEYDQKILELRNPALSAYFARIGGPNREEHENIVLRSCNMEAIYELSDSSEAHLNYIINSHDVEYNLRIIKKLFQQGISIIDKYGRTSNESREITKKIEKHAEALSQSKDIASLQEFLEWYRDYIKIVRTYRSFYSNWRENVGVELLRDANNHINKILDEIAKSKDAEVLYKAFKIQRDLLSFLQYKLKSDYSDNNNLRKAIRKTKDEKYNYLIVKNYYCSNEDFLKHAKVIIKSKSPEYNYLFAKDCCRRPKLINLDEDAEREKHAQVVIESCNPEYNYLFAKDISNANILDHMEAIIKSGDPQYCYLFAFNFKKADKKRLGEVVIASKNPRYNYLFAKDIKDSDKKEHLRVVAESGDVKYNYYSCLLNTGCDQNNRLIVLNSGNVEYNYELALKYPNNPLFEEHLKVVIDSGDEEFMAKVGLLKPSIIRNINKKIKLLQLS